jgi:hypothetical protein
VRSGWKGKVERDTGHVPQMHRGEPCLPAAISSLHLHKPSLTRKSQCKLQLKSVQTSTEVSSRPPARTSQFALLTSGGFAWLPNVGFSIIIKRRVCLASERRVCFGK